MGIVWCFDVLSRSRCGETAVSLTAAGRSLARREAETQTHGSAQLSTALCAPAVAERNVIIGLNSARQLCVHKV